MLRNDNSSLTLIGNKIKQARMQRGYSQSKLANIIGKDQQSIQRLEKGRVNPSYLYLVDVCEGLNMSLPELILFY